jgi:hypothetical protein
LVISPWYFHVFPIFSMIKSPFSIIWTPQAAPLDRPHLDQKLHHLQMSFEGRQPKRGCSLALPFG